jgi:hypothetical protein
MASICSDESAAKPRRASRKDAIVISVLDAAADKIVPNDFDL